MHRVLSAPVVLVVAFACNHEPAPQQFGEPIGDATATASLAEVLAAPTTFDNTTVVVVGEVRQACSAKGCWMELAAGKEAGASARVTFKDYGFFIPTDSRGARARVRGTVSVKTVEAAEVDHMEREGGHLTGKAADGSAREVRIVASGVELWRPH